MKVGFNSLGEMGGTEPRKEGFRGKEKNDHLGSQAQALCPLLSPNPFENEEKPRTSASRPYRCSLLVIKELREFKSMDVGHPVPVGLGDGELV